MHCIGSVVVSRHRDTFLNGRLVSYLLNEDIDDSLNSIKVQKLMLIDMVY